MLQLQVLLEGPGLRTVGNIISVTVSLMGLLSQHIIQAHLRIRGKGISSMLGCSLGTPQCEWRQVESCSGFHTLFFPA